MKHDAASTARAGVVVPIRSFSSAKARLTGFLDDEQRARAIQHMATRVVEAASPMRVVVVTSAPEVQRWARQLGVETIADPGSLDAAASAGQAALAQVGKTRAVIAHADLPLARTLSSVVVGIDDDEVALVPCHREDGTNVLSLPTAAEFRFAYGVRSFERHVAETSRLGLRLRIVRAPDLVVDVDAPEDLHHLDPSFATR
jgi:2-phospho-L-lactate guanylyltransferase